MIVGWVKTFLSTSTLIMICGIGTVIFTIILILLNPKLDKEKEKIYAAETV